MSNKHLGNRVHDLLDGRLNRDQSYVAMAHLGECEECNRLYQELRQAREALNSSSAGIDMRFTEQLLNRERIAQIASGESPAQAKAASGRERRPAVLLGIVPLVLILAVLGGAYLVGAPDEVALEFAEESPNNAQTVALAGPDAMRSGDLLRSWLHPEWDDSGLIPVGAHVTRSDDGRRVLVASLLAYDIPIGVTEQHGQLDPDALHQLPRAAVVGVDAYVLSYDPAQLVWQTGDVVIAVGCECPIGMLENVAATFPVAEQPGFVDRVIDGLGEMADTVSGD
jgi:anti-sigma factor RsiW